MGQEYTIVYGEEGDWEGLYIDGKLVYEGHEIPRHVLFEKMGIQCTDRQCADGWLEERGNLPNKLSEVKF
jgi:hypothetical protein